MPETVSNTSPLQYLYQAEQLDLLHELYGRVIVPHAVLVELSEGLARGVALPDVTKLDWVDVRRPAQGKTPEMIADLGPGERAALALAAERPGSLLIVDDADARAHARLLGLRFTGTLGVLLRAKRSGRLEELAPVLHRLDSLGFRLAATVRAAVLRLAGEAG